MFKFLHAADLHLDSPLRGLDRYDGCPVDEIRGATRKALDRLVRLAVAEKVAFVVIAGDVYDGDWPDHDARNKMTRELRLPEGVHLLDSGKPQTVHLAEYDVAVHGQSFATERVSEDLAASYPDPDPGCFNLGLLHTSADGREGSGRYAPCSVDTLRAKGYDYWALGHVHTREEVSDRDVPIVFPGNVQGRHIREPDAKGCVIVTVADRLTTREFHPLDVLRWATCSVDASEMASADDVATVFGDRIPSLLAEADDRNLAVRVEIVGQTPAHGSINADHSQITLDIQNAANDNGSGRVWVEKIRFLTRPPSSSGAIAGLNFDGPLGEIERLLDELRGDDATLGRFAEAELGELRKKIPLELKGGDGPDFGIDLGSAETLREILGHVRPLLDFQFQRVKGA